VTRSWSLAVARDDLARTELLDVAVPDPAPGQAVLRVDRVGVTANNVTYAVLGESFRYWEFFPAPPGLGHVPLWGFAQVAASRADGVVEGSRVYGYLPPAGHLLVEPAGGGPRGFRDTSPHRAALPSPYNAYALTTGDAAYDPAREDLQVLFRPLFLTSFVLADAVEAEQAYGAQAVVLSSASSKTAYGTAFLLRGKGPEVVGLTSAGNVGFVRALGCYDRVLSYDEVTALPAERPTAYLDLSGSTPLRRALHDHLGGALVRDLVVGVTSQDSSRPGALAGPRPTAFFAPDRITARTAEWGRAGFDARYGQAWQRFATVAQDWVDVVVGHGPSALREVWLEVLSGRSAPRTGHVLQL
jgi:hypothetical protein